MSRKVAGVPTIGRPTDIEGVSVLDGRRAGPTLALMGFVHGNERAGAAIWETLGEVKRIERGSVRLMVGHPDAAFRHAPPVRQVDEDLNRAFFFDAEREGGRETVETRRVRDLRKALAGVDVLVDFHTTSSSTGPFCALFGTGEEISLFPSMRGLTVTAGWDRFVSGTAIQWVKAQGGKGFIVEAGQHDDPGSCEVISAVIRDVLADLGMVKDAREHGAAARGGRIFDLVQRVSVEGPGFEYHQRKPQNFEPVRDGEVIGKDRDGRLYRAPLDLGGGGVIVMPTAEDAFKDQVTLDAFFIGVAREKVAVQSS